MISLLSGKKIHIIGVGGIGMSAIAEILINFGCNVSGSDISENGNTLKLKKLGATLYKGHHAGNVKDVDLVVYSSAVPKNNPEIISASDKNIPVLKRAEILADIMRLKNGIAIAGTHGKTTTTSLVATILRHAGIDPTYLIGGIVRNLSGHAHVGKGDLFVVEADESDGTFLDLSPVIAGITNIDFDHLDFYGDEKNLIKAFDQFANLVPFYGKILLNYDDLFSRKISEQCKKPLGLISTSVNGPQIDFSIDKFEEDLGSSCFDLIHFGKKVGAVEVNLNGIHNIQNCLIAIGISREIGLTFDQIIKGLKDFEGVGRRLEVLKRNDSHMIIDDYGHHPTELQTTIRAVNQLKKDKDLIVIFEPHRYSRTHNCWDEFLKSFGYADKVYVLPIYSAGEDEIEGISSQKLVTELSVENAEKYNFSKNLKAIFEEVNLDNKIILTMGAGKIGRDIREYVKID